MKTGITAALLASALILSGVSSGVAQAAPRPSGKCEQIGAKKKFKNQVFVCTKRGKKLVWRVQSNQTVKPGASTEPFAESTDPVTAKLERMMATLPMPNGNASAPPIRYVIEDPGDQKFVPRLEKQFVYLAQAFPEFSWTSPGLAFIPRTREWLGPAMREAGCQERVVEQSLGWYNTVSSVWGIGVFDCNPNVGQVGIMGLNLPNGQDPGFMWDMIVSQEYSEAMRSKRFASNPVAINSPRPINWWDVNMPSWMREGMEPALNSIATSAQTRKWEMIRIEPFSMCGTGVLRDYAPMETGWDCHYTLGTEAVELMMALYGWDAPLTWWGSFGDQRDPYVAFKNAYGDDYDTFERYASEFFQWRANGVPMSEELLNRLR